MNVVLENLFLRRPRIEYVSPPVCPVHFSASGIAIFDQCFNDQTFCNLGKVNDNFLLFIQPPDALAFNIYYSTQESGQPFQLVIDGLLPYTAIVFTAGTYYFTVNTASGTESIPFPPVVASGDVYVPIAIPHTSDTVSVNLYKDGVKIASNIIGVLVESSAEGWYQATKITTDGESPLQGCTPVLLSGTVPVPPPPPPPPPPGPDWTSFVYGVPICLGCQSVLFDGIPNNAGGFSPPGAGFGLHTELIGGHVFEYTINSNGFVLGSYTGPDAHCRLTLAASSSGGSIDINNYVLVQRSGVNLFEVSGAAMYVSGNYDFILPGGTAIEIRVYVQGEAHAGQALTVSGSITNIP